MARSADAAYAVAAQRLLRLERERVDVLVLLRELATYEDSSHFTHSLHPDDKKQVVAMVARLEARQEKQS